MDNTSSMYLNEKLNRDANRFLPTESKDYMNSASYTEICRLGEGHSLCP